MDKVYAVETIAKSHNVTIKGQSYTLKKNISLKFLLTVEEYNHLKSNQYIKIQEVKEVVKDVPENKNTIIEAPKKDVTVQEITDSETDDESIKEEKEENKMTKDAAINEVVKKVNNFSSGKNKKNKKN